MTPEQDKPQSKTRRERNQNLKKEALRVDRELHPELYAQDIQECSMCHIDKSKLDFDIDHSECKKCRGLISTERRQLDPALALWRSARSRAKQNGREFSITLDDVRAIWTNTCPIYGFPLQVNEGRAQPNSPSIDRIDNNQGYVPGNIAIVSNRFNSEKRDLTPDILRRMLAYIEGRLIF